MTTKTVNKLSSESRCQRLLNYTTDIFYSFSNEVGGVYYSSRVEDILGYSPKHLAENPYLWHDSIHPDDLAMVDAAIEGFKSGQSFDLEYRIKHAKGHWVWLHDRNIFTQQETGFLIEGMASDISARKNAEEKLRTSEAQYRSLVEDQGELICRFLPDSTLTFVNRAYADFYGKEPHELIGSRYLDLQNSEDQKQSLKHLRCMTPDKPIKSVEQQRINVNGTPHWHIWNIRAFFNDDGSAQSFQAIATDITRRKEIEKQLAQAQKMEAIGQLTGGIAHDFNNLLQVVVTSLQIAREEIEDETVSAFLGKAIEAAHQGGELTQQLLAFSRRQELKPTRISPNDIISEMLVMLKRTLGELIEVQTDLAPALPFVKLDANSFKNAILNLSINAKDAVERDGVLKFTTRLVNLTKKRTLSNTVQPAGTYVELSIDDNGHGIPVDVIDHVLEPFFTTKETGKGTGLGLSMVYGFVRQSGGFLDIKSKVGRGTSIKLYFPILEDIDTTPAPIGTGIKISQPPSSKTHHKAQPQPTILIVEDDPDLREVCVHLLGKIGYKTIEAADGPSALHLLKTHQGINLLLSDVVMPNGMNGVELALTARQNYPDLKVLLTSGYPDSEIKKSGFSELPFALLKKPYSKNDLAATLTQLLD